MEKRICKLRIVLYEIKVYSIQDIVFIKHQDWIYPGS